MTVKEVAEYLGIHPFTVQRHAREGKIPGFKIGADWKFEKKHMQKWLKEKSTLRTKNRNGLL